MHLPRRQRAEPPTADSLRARITGLEAEHAILFLPANPEEREPRRREIYELIEEVIAERFATLPSGLPKQGIFLPNGGLVQYEALPTREADGLLETATAEGRDPLDTALAHRALEDIVADAIPEVEARLAKRGTPGQVLLGKNCTDYKGNYYGAHENFEVRETIPGWARPLAATYVGLVWIPAVVPIALGILLLLSLAAFSLSLLLVSGLLALATLLPLVGYRFRRLREGFARLARKIGSQLTNGLQWLLENAGMRLLIAWSQYLVWCLKPFFLRAFQRDLPGFLATRILYSGAGAIADDGRLMLSQRAAITGATAGLFVNEGTRPMLDLRDLHWPPHAPLNRRKRLHLMMGDSNMSDVATYLKVGLTQLILDVIEAGREIPGVQLASPRAAMQAISESCSPETEVELIDGTKATAIEIQRRYLAVVKQHFRPALEEAEGDAADGAGDAEEQPWSAVGRERVRDLVRRWEAMLDALEATPSLLYRDVDWVTKSDLLAQSEEHSSLPGILAPDHLERRRKLDLLYHRLGPEGYHSQLYAAGRLTHLFTDEERARAQHTAPRGTRAWVRGKLVERYGRSPLDLAVGWSHGASTEPFELTIPLDDPYDDRVPPNLPEAPTEEGGRRLDRVAGQLPILPGGTGRSTSLLTGYWPAFLFFLVGANLAVAVSLPGGVMSLVVGLFGTMVMAPLVAVSLVALLRQLTGRGRFEPEEVLSATINAAILNTAVVVVCRLVTGQPAIW